MSDAYRRYRAIRQALMQCFPNRSHSRAEQHLNTLTMLICGIVGSEQVHLPRIADHAPGGHTAHESQVIRYRRWLLNERIGIEEWMLPVAQALLHALAAQPLRLIMDGSTVGRGCMCLMVSVVYHGRALPLVWVVVKGKKGHLCEELHCELLALVQAIMPAEATVIFLGDGEFDGTTLQTRLQQAGWLYVCRTASNILVTAFDRQFALGKVPLRSGQAKEISPAWMTAAEFGPVHLLAVWDEAYTDPIFLVTNMAEPEAALAHYRLRATIETLFSDQKNRGFHIQRSHLADPQRLSRLLIASCLAYIWIIYLGVQASHEHWRSRLHRRKRCDLSLFQLGRRFLARCLREGESIPEGLLVPPELPASLTLSN